MASLYMNRVKPENEKNAEVGQKSNDKSSLENQKNEDEILDWASNLNFEEYQNTWTNLITLPKWAITEYTYKSC